MRDHLKFIQNEYPQGELERAKSSRTSIELSDMRGERGLFLRRKIPFSGSKNRFLADFAPGDFEEILAKSVKGVAVAGEAVPPSTGFSKLVLKSCNS